MMRFSRAVDGVRLLRFQNNYSLRSATSVISSRNKSDSVPDPPQPEHPLNRTLKILRNDLRAAKHYMENFRLVRHQTSWDPDDRPPEQFPHHCDIVVIGGGVIGSSIAYWLKQRAPHGISVAVIEKDPSYSQASTVLSCGGIRQQFSLKENIEMSLYGAEFMRNIKKHLSVEGHPDPDVQFQPCGYMFLASEEGAEQLENNVQLQKSLGAKVELLSAGKLKSRFPWLNTDGIAVGSCGLENEGWIDPWALLHAFKRKAISLGTEYVNGEAVGFEFKKMHDIYTDGVSPGSFETLDKLLVKTDKGEIRSIKFAIAVIAAGAESGKVAQMARLGVSSAPLLQHPLPVEQRKRYVYCVNCPDAPGIDLPFLVDHSGMYCRREGLGGNYLTSMSPLPEEEPGVENLDVDYNFFEEKVWPLLASRVPAFKCLKLKSAWAGYYDYNVFDENGIIGPHPYYYNLYIASGFSGHGLQHAPAVGRAIMEMILDGGFETVDLSRLNFDRCMLNMPLMEQGIV